MYCLECLGSTEDTVRRLEKQTLPQASPISLSTSGSNMSSRKGLKMPSKMREVDRRMIELRLLRRSQRRGAGVEISYRHL